jgi:RHS repeat-associated protein
MFEDGNYGGMYARSHYQYDTVGREAAVWRDEDGSKGDRFHYSTDNQLTGARYKGDWAWAGDPNNPERTVDYAYRPDMLNRQSVTDNGAVTNYASPSGMNQYGSVGSQAISYDDRFNVASYNGATFTYDAENRLVGGSMQAIYDGLGRCVKRTINGVTRFITYDDWNPIYEWDASGNPVGANFYGAKADELIGRWDSSWGFLFFKQDRQGSVMEVLDQGGGIVEKYRYDAFGKPTISDWNGNGRTSSAIENRFMYTGREWIAELGIYDYRHRMYHPGLGRFLQTDPMGLQTEGEKLSAGQKALYSPGGSAPEAFSSSEMNLFRYCGDDPVDKSDPLGLLSIIIPGFGPGQRDPTGEGAWSNQRFIQEAMKIPDGQVYSREQMKAAMEAIKSARANGDRTLNIAGYSLGAAAAVNLARDVGKSGIGVDNLVTVDIVRAPGFNSALLPNPVPVSSNVKAAYNYYQHTGGFHPTNFSGTPVAGAANIMANRLLTEHHAHMPVAALRYYDADAR